MFAAKTKKSAELQKRARRRGNGLAGHCNRACRMPQQRSRGWSRKAQLFPKSL